MSSGVFSKITTCNLLQIVTLFVGVVGTLAAPGTVRATDGTSGVDFADRDIITRETAEMISLPLPGTENLEEKAIPLSKLVSHQLLPPTGQDSLSENSQLSTELPGTKNLAEKRIPVPILEKLYQRPKLDRSSV